VTNNNGFWIIWLDLLELLYNYNQFYQLTISDWLRLAPFLAVLWVSSLPLWRMTNNTRISSWFYLLLRLPWTVTVWRIHFWFRNHLILVWTVSHIEYPHPWKRLVIYSLWNPICWLLVSTETSAESLLTCERVLTSRWLAMDSHYLRYSGFQAVFTEPIPSNCHIRHNIVYFFYFLKYSLDWKNFK
jgi:hypothetical protein